MPLWIESQVVLAVARFSLHMYQRFGQDKLHFVVLAVMTVKTLMLNVSSHKIHVVMALFV